MRPVKRPTQTPARSQGGVRAMTTERSRASRPNTSGPWTTLGVRPIGGYSLLLGHPSPYRGAPRGGLVERRAENSIRPNSMPPGLARHKGTHCGRGLSARTEYTGCRDAKRDVVE
jgi:hypothetical protein